jgi:hypothetical protein
MSDDLFKIIPIYEDDFKKLHDEILFFDSKNEESIKDIYLRLECINQEVSDSLNLIIEDSKEKIFDSFLAINNDIKQRHEMILSEIDIIKSSIELNKSNLRYIENCINDILSDINDIKLNNSNSEFMTVYNLENEVIVQKLINKINELEIQILELQKKPEIVKKKSFFKRIFCK